MKRENTHTIRTFQFHEPLLPIVKKWARECGFIVETKDNKIFCEKGIGIMTAPIQVNLEESDGNITFEAFLKVDAISMFATLFLAPDEMQLDSGDGELFLDRKIARDKVNKLLARLDQPPIG